MKNDFDIIFLGGLFPKETEEEIYENSKGSIQSAANVLQWNIIEGLDLCNNQPVKIFNSLYIGAYPLNYKKILVKTYNFNHSINNNDINIGFINILGLKHFFRYVSLKPYLKKWAKDSNNKKVLIGYALTGTFVRLIKYVKKINSNITTCIIVPDLPEYMNTKNTTSIVYAFLKNAEINSIRKNMDFIDKYVLLTEHMKDFMNLNKKYTVVEGVASDVFNNIEPFENKHDLKTILYTGTLNEKYGLINLVEAFKLIPYDNYRLVICGAGDSEKRIFMEAQNDCRILFKGQQRRQDVLKFQKSATVLINPRSNNEEYTKYSFPSKILEYLSSGVPTIAYKLDGIPDEYDKYINYVIGNEISDLASKIIELCEKNEDDLFSIGEAGKKFVLNNKNKVVQANKIMKLLCK